MKYATFFVTFFSYISLHSMRTSYSFNKSFIKQRFCIESSLLAIFDAIIYIGLGVGFFLRYKITSNENIFQTYLKMGIIATLSFSVIPLASLYNIGVCDDNSNFTHQNTLMKIVMIGSLLSYGFFQFVNWPILLTLISRYLDLREEGAQLGCWSSAGDIGNIFGFFLSSIIVINLHGSWQLSMVISSIFCLFMCLCIYICINPSINLKIIGNKQIYPNQQNDKVQNSSSIYPIQKDQQFDDYNSSTFPEFLDFIMVTISDTQNCLYLISTALYKSALYGFLLWSPIFLVSIGNKQYQSYIPIIFNVSTLFGSILFGKLYEIQNQLDKQEQLQIFYNKFKKQQKNLFERITKVSLKYRIFLFSLCLMSLFGLFILVNANVIVYGVLSFFMGFFLGGIFNVLITHEVLKITNHNQKKLDMMSTLLMSIGNLLVGCLQLIISFFLHKNDKMFQQTFNKKKLKSSVNYMSVFIILLIALSIAAVISFIRIYRSSSSYNQSQNQLQIQKRQQKVQSF